MERVCSTTSATSAKTEPNTQSFSQAPPSRDLCFLPYVLPTLLLFISPNFLFNSSIHSLPSFFLSAFACFFFVFPPPVSPPFLLSIVLLPHCHLPLHPQVSLHTFQVTFPRLSVLYFCLEIFLEPIPLFLPNFNLAEFCFSFSPDVLFISSSSL